MAGSTATASIVREPATFPHPIQALHRGRFVRVIALGDQEGKSPVYLAVDEAGNSYWASLAEFRIIDPQALPVRPPFVAAEEANENSGRSR